jgi:hypothetical protein
MEFTQEKRLMNTGPIFIGGLSFSGKTQLRLLLCAHPNIVITRHTRMWTRYYWRFGDLHNPRNFERCLKSMLSSKHILALKPDPESIRREFWQGQPTYERLFCLIHKHYAEQVGKPRWGDQLGGIEWFADQIFAAYPDAQMIHMIRDPRERYRASLSVSLNRPGKVGWEIAQWRRSARLADRNRRLYPDRYMVVLYEYLLTDTEKLSQRICSFLNEDDSPLIQALKDGRGSGSNREIEILSVSGTREQGAKMNRVRYLSKIERAFIQSTSKPAMRAFGYEPESLNFSLKDWLYFISVKFPINLFSMMARQTGYFLKSV